MLETTVQEGNVKVTFRNTVRNTLKLRILNEKWKIDDDAPDSDVRLLFIRFCAFFQSAEGLDFKPIAEEVLPQNLEIYYGKLIDQISLEFLWECHEAIASMHKPLSTGVETPDYAMTEEQKADPNS